MMADIHLDCGFFDKGFFDKVRPSRPAYVIYILLPSYIPVTGRWAYGSTLSGGKY